MEHISSRKTTGRYWDIAEEKPWCEFAFVAQMKKGIKACTKNPTGTACRKLWTAVVGLQKAEKAEGLRVYDGREHGSILCKNWQLRLEWFGEGREKGLQEFVVVKEPEVADRYFGRLQASRKRAKCCGVNKLQQSHPSFGVGRRPMWERFAFASGCKTNEWRPSRESGRCWSIKAEGSLRHACISLSPENWKCSTRKTR